MTQPTESTLAPHGRDENGVALAPYGLTLQGHPKKSRRGAQPGQRGNRGTGTKTSARPAMSKSSLSDEERKGMLCELGDSLLVNPLATLSTAPFIENRLGRKHADALAGDAFILSNYLPGIADGLILLAKTKPGVLAWMDKIEENAPYVVLTQALLGAGKAFAENHLNPNPQVANAGRSLAAMKMAAMADAVNAQAANIKARAQQQAEFSEAA